MSFSQNLSRPVAEVVPFTKLPPQNLEAERAILASVLMDNNALNSCMEHLSPEDFYRDAHQIIYQAMVDLSAKNEPCDLITVSSTLENQAKLEMIGGVSYLSALVDNTPSAANVASYAKLVREKSLARKLLSAATDIITDCYQEADVNALIDSAESRIFAVSERKAKSSIAAVRELVKEGYKKIEELYENRGQLTGLTSGFKDLDKMLHGLQKGDLVIVAGRPSMGKTAFALNLVENAARNAAARVAVFSLEMGKEQLVMRMLTSQARIDASHIRRGELSESDWPRLLEACDDIGQMQVFIDDVPAQSTHEIRAKCRRIAKEHGLDLVVVDYLQLMRSGSNVQSREQEISEISRSLKALAKELRVPVVALSQLNRSLESRVNKRPMMSDLRESGAIEQDADVIMFVYRDEVYDPETPQKGVAEIIIGKHRNGQIGTVRLAFLNQYTRFEDLAYDPQMEYLPTGE